MDTSFVEVLREAKVYGCGYGLGPLGEHEGIVRILWLVGGNESALRRAFEIFKSWAEGSDDDALSLQIILLDSGGYLLLLGPDPDRAQVRIVGYGSILRPLIYTATFAKRMDTTSDFVPKLQAYVRQALSPVMFGAALAPRWPGDEPRLLEDCPELVLYNVKVINEAEAEAEPAFRHFVERERGQAQTEGLRLRRSDLPSPSESSKRRRELLEKLFPVTIFRIRHELQIANITAAFARQGIRSWEIEQAVCNLQLTQLILNQSSIGTDRESASPWGVLSTRFEDLETTLVVPTRWQLEEQLLADAQALLTALVPGVDPKISFFECAGELAHLGYLDA